jgi:hypothetical protein
MWERLENGHVKVPWRMLHKDQQGYYVPGLGRIRIHEYHIAFAHATPVESALICAADPGTETTEPGYTAQRIVAL